MQTSVRPIYLDSSALVKLVIDEAESESLHSFLSPASRRFSSALARVEVERAVRPHGKEAVCSARRLMGGLDLIEVSDEVLERAATIGPPELRSLDALHLASASLLSDPDLELVTYDRRMAAAARQLGWRAVSPR